MHIQHTASFGAIDERHLCPQLDEQLSMRTLDQRDLHESPIRVAALGADSAAELSAEAQSIVSSSDTLLIVGPFVSASQELAVEALCASSTATLVRLNGRLAPMVVGEGGPEKHNAAEAERDLEGDLEGDFEIAFELLPLALRRGDATHSGYIAELGDEDSVASFVPKALLQRIFPADWTLSLKQTSGGYTRLGTFANRPPTRELLEITSRACGVDSSPSPRAPPPPAPPPPLAPPPPTAEVRAYRWGQLDEGDALRCLMAASRLRLSAWGRDELGSVIDEGSVHLFAASEHGWRSRPAIELAAYARLEIGGGVGGGGERARRSRRFGWPSQRGGRGGRRN